MWGKHRCGITKEIAIHLPGSLLTDRASKTVPILTYLAGSLAPVSFKAPYLSDAEFKINMILVVWIFAKRSDF